MIEELKRRFKGRFSRIDRYADGARLRWWPDTDVYVDGSGATFCDAELTPSQRRTYAEVRDFASDPAQWTSLWEVQKTYGAFDAVVLRVPDGWYPTSVPVEDRARFDQLRPFYRIVGGTRRGQQLARGLAAGGVDYVRGEACSFDGDPAFASDFLGGMGFDTWVVAAPPYDAPTEGLAKGEGE